MNKEKYLLPITGIGSLPFSDIKRAVDFSLEFDFPFLPQMTSLKENMIEQARTADYLALKLFSNQINFKKINNFKIQIAGPNTSKLDPQLILNNISKINKPFNHSPIVFIDEPSLQKIDDIFLSFIHGLKREGYRIGIHCCNNKCLIEYLKLDIDFLSIDGNFLNTIKNENLDLFFKKNKTLVLGIIPTDRSYEEEFLFKKYQSFIKKNINQIIISPACGLAGMTEIEALKTLKTLKKLRKRFIN